VIVVLAVAMSFLVTLTATYSTIVERTREIGILKSLGASKSYIVRLILEESLLVSVLGLISGFLLTWGVIGLISIRFPSLPVIIELYWRVAVVGISMGGTVLGALYPAWKAAKLDPVTALGYE
jgi:putative ABC transport system permease protein